MEADVFTRTELDRSSANTEEHGKTGSLIGLLAPV